MLSICRLSIDSFLFGSYLDCSYYFYISCLYGTLFIINLQTTFIKKDKTVSSKYEIPLKNQTICPNQPHPIHYS